MQQGLAPRRRYGRDSVEFARTLSFTDGLFAIAATLLVIDLAVPILHHGSSVHELATKLNNEREKFISFFISFAVIGRYWAAHHTYFSALGSIDRALIGLNLLYLCFIALLPFPTALLGEYFSNPLSITIYAVNVAIVSGMEVVLFGWAHDHDLLEKKLPQDVYRFGVAMSLAPVLFFLLSIPVAFLTTTTLAVCTWFLGIPLAALAGRWKPEGADELLLG